MKSKCCNKRVLKSKDENICYCCGRVCEVVEEKCICGMYKDGWHYCEKHKDPKPLNDTKSEPHEEDWELSLWNNENIVWNDAQSFRHTVEFIKQEKEKSEIETLKDLISTVPKFKKRIEPLLNQARQEMKDELVEEIGKLKTDHPITESNSYDIGQNHGRQEFKATVINLINQK